MTNDDLDIALDGQGSVDGKIAVIGMSGRFPGAGDLDSFWSNLRDGVESIRRFTEDELLAAGESLDNIRNPAYVPAAASLADIDMFDAAFFGMSPRDAAVFDPQHRMFLECAWEAFEHAGYIGERMDGAVGVFASCGLSEYMFKNVLANEQVTRAVGEWLIRHTGNDTNFLATRVSYEFDLRGPSLNVQTACSSTLVAVHLACQSLLSGECDTALAGGSVVSPTQNHGYFYKEGEILSPDGHCRAFDVKSAGTIISSACAAVLLKPLDRALEDRDNVLAVILGSAINNDGRAKVGYLAPSVGGQGRVVTEALAVAGVDARDVSYVEAHGTGTLIGDPIEIAGITQAYREHTDDTQFCAIGSLKTNIGHTGEASGVAALIKTVLSLQHAELPPSLHFEAPNPQASFPTSPFFVNAELRSWEPGPGGTRIAGITGLGAGGTNAHLIVEEAPRTEPSGPSRQVQLITVSARSQDGAERAASELAAHLRDHPDANLADVAYTRLAGRKAFRARRAVIATDALEAAAALENPKAVVAHQNRGETPTVVFMMPGGGAQYAGMGQQLYESEAVYREAVDECCKVISPTLGLDLRSVMFVGPTASADDIAAATKRLERPSIALPALFTTEYAMAKLLESFGIRPAAMIGHSAGEYVAACLAGVISMQDGLALVAVRGRLFETLPVGAMLSVPMGVDELRARMHGDLSIAAINGAELCVASGPVAQIDELEASLAADDIDAVRVHIDVAAHSAMLQPILPEFAAFCRTIRFTTPSIPYVSNLTGTWITDAQVVDPQYWVDHLRHSVRFSDGIEAVLEDPDRVLLEVGPGRTLTAFARMASRPATGSAATLRHPRETVSDLAVFMTAVARTWVSGVDLDPADVFAGEARHRVALPTYPFDRQRYWIEPDSTDSSGSRKVGLHKLADIGDWFYAPSWKRTAAAPPSESPAATWLCVTGSDQFGERLATTLRAGRRRVIVVDFGERLRLTGADRFELDPARASDWLELVEELKRSGAMPDHVVHVTAAAPVKRRSLRSRHDPVESLDTHVRRDHASLLFLAQAFAAAAEPMRLTVVTSGVHALADEAIHPERALLHGACRVIPRELGHVRSVAIDVDTPRPDSPDEERLLGRTVRELTTEPDTDVVLIRRGERWVRDFGRVRLPAAAASPWRDRGVYLITGGLGGIGLAVAEHIATSVQDPTLFLVGRSSVAPESQWDDLCASPDTDPAMRRRLQALRRIRDAGADLVVASADVTDEAAMRSAIETVRRTAGRITGVVHSAGILRDALIALRTPSTAAPVVDVKAKGALVIEKLLADDPPDLMVLCSSVSSIIGLPGQVDYTAANAFLDSFAAKASRDSRTRVISVNWNAWQEVGMAVDASRSAELRERVPFSQADLASPTHLFDHAESDGDDITLTSVMSRDRNWLLTEHAIRGGDSLIPGTGYIELIRSAVLNGHADQVPVELSDVFFLSPFAVSDGEVRTLKIRVQRDTGGVTVFSDAEASPHATAVARVVDAGEAPVRDLGAIRARCDLRTETFDGYSAQPFMQFGPRWGNLRSVEYGDHEALVTTHLPDAFTPELSTLWLHPALLDMATGSAQALIPGFDQAGTFYVPFSYGRLVARGPLPARAVSHVTLRTSSARDLAVFDIVVCDEAGHEVVSVDGFTMRRVSENAPLTTRRSSGVPLEPAPLEGPIESALREGMLPTEGVDALDRLLAADVAPQMVASSVDLHSWIAKVDAEASAGDKDEAAPEGGPQFDRPNVSSEFAEPATPVERELAEMWRELLGITRVGRDDDFFELGGQSLIAVRLFTRMRKRYSVDLPLSTLFEAPTISQCASIVASKLGIDDTADAVPDEAAAHADAIRPATPPLAGDGFRSLVTIQKGGDRVPFFCAHGAGGNVLNFRDLSIAMGRSQPFYGLQARGVNGVLTPHATIEEMAAAYLDDIRTIRPHGPYIFGGYSGGGLVAYEMARQVSAQGESVPLVVLLDTITTAVDLIHITMRGRLRQLVDDPRAYLRHLVKYHLHERRQAKELARLDEILARGEPVPSELRELHMSRSFGRAAAAYSPLPWKGRVVLMRADEMNATFDVLGEAYGWDAIVDGPIELVRVPGNHNTLVLEPNASTLVRALRDTLDSISAAARSTSSAANGSVDSSLATIAQPVSSAT